MKNMLLLACAALGAVSLFAATPLETQLAAKHKIFTSDTWGGGHRIIFDYDGKGRKAWIVEPVGVAPRADKPWVWTMQWMGAFINRTAAPDLMKHGFYHVHLEAFDRRADEVGVKLFAEFQDFLVKELGFAPKAKLIGMSWGGFFSVRYAATYPEKVERIYLDAPLMNFDSFNGSKTDAAIGPWAAKKPADGKWTTDPRMPINLAEPIAKAGIPVILLYGGADPTCVPKLNCELFVPRFKAAGGDITVKCRGMYGHHPHGFEHEDIPQALKFFGAIR